MDKTLSANSVYFPSGSPKLPMAKTFEINFIEGQLGIQLLVGGQNTGDSLSPQSAMVDNTTNNNNVILTIDGINYPVLAGQFCSFPVIAGDYPKVSVTSSGTGHCVIALSNQKMPAILSSTGVMQITGSVINSPSANIQTLNDYSGTIATASTSQQAVAAGDITQFLLIQNLGSTPLYVNFGAAATAGEGSIAIAENDFLIFKPDFVPAGSINVLSATASAPYTIKGY